MLLRALNRAGLLALALLASPGAPRAQHAPPADVAPASPPLDAAESETLSRALVFDPTQLAKAAPKAPLRVPGVAQPRHLDVTGKNDPDGTGTVTIKQPLPADWDAKLGADLTVAAPPPVTYEPDRPLPSSQRLANSAGAAWASVGLIDNFASLDARLDAGSDQGQIGTTFQHSMPFGSRFSLTLRDRYAVSENLGAPDAAPAGLPVMALPQVAAGPEQVWSNQKDVKFNILPTGTTLSAGVAASSTDPVTHNSLSADQKVYGPLHVTTSVTDIGQPTANKSIKGAVKLTW